MTALLNQRWDWVAFHFISWDLTHTQPGCRFLSYKEEAPSNLLTFPAALFCCCLRAALSATFHGHLLWARTGFQCPQEIPVPVVLVLESKRMRTGTGRALRMPQHCFSLGRLVLGPRLQRTGAETRGILVLETL